MYPILASLTSLMWLGIALVCAGIAYLLTTHSSVRNAFKFTDSVYDGVHKPFDWENKEGRSHKAWFISLLLKTQSWAATGIPLIILIVVEGLIGFVRMLRNKINNTAKSPTGSPSSTIAENSELSRPDENHESDKTSSVPDLRLHVDNPYDLRPGSPILKPGQHQNPSDSDNK